MLPDNGKIYGTKNLVPYSLRRGNYCPTYSIEQGGVALNNPSLGLEKWIWEGYVKDGNIIIHRKDKPNPKDWEEGKYGLIIHKETEGNRIIEFDFTFDQNMRYCAVWNKGNGTIMKWYDPKKREMTYTEFPTSKHGRIMLDDKRDFAVPNSDIIFACMEEKRLGIRIQRRRFEEFNPLITFSRKKVLWRFGLNKNNQFSFHTR